MINPTEMMKQFEAQDDELKRLRAALVRIVEHYHYPGGHETPAYNIAKAALASENTSA
jgi:hypothetical protein